MDKNGQPMTDDAELAKVLEGMQDAAAAVTAAPATGLSFEESQVPPTPTPATDPNAPATPQPAVLPSDALPPVESPVTDTATITPGDAALTIPSLAPSAMPVATDPALESIKKDALEQLRPLVDKLDLEPDEKFDTLLLIIRSTDDKSLVSQAYESAKLIADEAKRATALLDIVKEIDYFSHPGSQQPQI
ncbi:MAG: hypothetical protein WBB39_01435 [Candidatus Saccharimonadales bacterium]